MVLDPDREYLSEFYRPQRGDVVLNPLDERCPRWTPWLELRPGYADADAEAQAESLFPDPLRQADERSTKPSALNSSSRIGLEKTIGRPASSCRWI